MVLLGPISSSEQQPTGLHGNLNLRFGDYEERLSALNNENENNQQHQDDENDTNMMETTSIETSISDVHMESLLLGDFHESYGEYFYPVWDQLATSLPNLKHLYLHKTYQDPGRDENRLHVEGFGRIVENLATSSNNRQHLDVLFLDLSWDYKWNGALHESFQKLHSVSDLRLEGLGINTEDWPEFANTLSQLGVKRLYLSRPDAAPDVDRHLEHKYLRLDSTCQLEELHLSSIHVEDIDVWVHVVEALRKTPSLVKLKVDMAVGVPGSGLYPRASRGFPRAISRLLKANQFVQEVALNQVRLDTRPCKRMARALRENKTLRKLQICDCGMRGSAFTKILAPALVQHPKLEHLELRQNIPSFKFKHMLDFISKLLPKQNSSSSPLKYLAYSAGEDGHDKDDPLTLEQATALLQLLRSSYFLQNLDIPPIPFPNIKNEMGILLRLNAAGRRYLVLVGEKQDERTKVQDAFAVLSAVSDDLDCVFYHLRENPVIVASLLRGN